MTSKSMPSKPNAVLLHRDLVDLDVVDLKLAGFLVHPEVDGVLLLGLILVVEDDIGEPAIALHAAYRLDLLEQKIEVSIELRVVEHEGSVH